jgi:subtilisin family serine protease
MGCVSTTPDSGDAGDLAREAPGTELIVRLRSDRVLSDRGTGLDALDRRLDELGATGVRAVFRHPAADAELGRRHGLDRTFRLTVPGDAQDALAVIRGVPGVRDAAPNHVGQLAAVPDDPLYSLQWHYDLVGAPAAWDTTTGAGVVVAVVDSGVDEGPLDGFGGTLLGGYNAIDGSTDASDVLGHGTHVAGTVGQATDNGLAVAGLAYGADILPVRISDASGQGTDADLADGLTWAVDNGADVVNLSLGFVALPIATEAAIQYAYDQGVTVVAASGNDGLLGFLAWPAAFESTIAVGAVGSTSVRTGYSNGGIGLDLVAPGGDSTLDDDGDGLPDLVWQETFDPVSGVWAVYGAEGTSMASPHVAGAAALLVAQGHTDPDVVRMALAYGAADTGASGWDIEHGHGVLDIERSLQIAPLLPTIDTLDILQWRELPGVGEVTVQWKTDQFSGTEVVDVATGLTVALDPTPTKRHSVVVAGASGTVDLVLVSDNHVGHDELVVTVTIP